MSFLSLSGIWAGKKKMNNAIIYATMSGHSKKIANNISSKLSIKAYNVKEDPKLSNVDNLFIICGIYGGLISPDMQNYLKTLNSDDIKKAYVIMSSYSGDYSRSNLKTILDEKGIVVADELSVTGGFLLARMFRPNKTDIKACVDFAEKVIKE